MKRTTSGMFAVTLATLASAPSNAQDTLWAPNDFDGAWVEVADKAKNGCWTNIGETREYASDQLELAGFKVIEKPVAAEGELHPVIAGNYVILAIEVTASRWNNGLCVGHVLSYFVGSVVPRKDNGIIIVNPIGPPDAWTIWDEKNLNNLVLDHFKSFVPNWVTSGQFREDGEH